MFAHQNKKDCLKRKKVIFPQNFLDFVVEIRLINIIRPFSNMKVLKMLSKHIFGFCEQGFSLEKHNGFFLKILNF
jgi:hypothetical protein